METEPSLVERIATALNSAPWRDHAANDANDTNDRVAEEEDARSDTTHVMGEADSEPEDQVAPDPVVDTRLAVSTPQEENATTTTTGRALPSPTASAFQTLSYKRPKLDTTSGDTAPTSECPICFDAWTTNGTHRVVSLKCGHLFGQHCITRWIGRSSACPSCKARASTRDVRPIYASLIQALDSSELEELRDHRKKTLRSLEKLRKEVQDMRERFARDALILECTRKDLCVKSEETQRLKTEVERCVWPLSFLGCSSSPDCSHTQTQVVPQIGGGEGA
jgi:hypothetical protein